MRKQELKIVFMLISSYFTFSLCLLRIFQKIFVPDFKQVTQIFHLICFSTDSISTKEETHHSNKFIWFFSLSFVKI